MAKMMRMKMAAMKSMKMKKAMKVSKVARGRNRKSVVLKGNKEKTPGGLKATDIMKNKWGKAVSKKASAAAKKRAGYKVFQRWGAAVKQARKVLGITGKQPVKKGTAFYTKVRDIFNKSK